MVPGGMGNARLECVSNGFLAEVGEDRRFRLAHEQSDQELISERDLVLGQTALKFRVGSLS